MNARNKKENNPYQQISGRKNEESMVMSISPIAEIEVVNFD